MNKHLEVRVIRRNFAELFRPTGQSTENIESLTTENDSSTRENGSCPSGSGCSALSILPEIFEKIRPGEQEQKRIVIERRFALGKYIQYLPCFNFEKKKNKISNNEEFDPGSG